MGTCPDCGNFLQGHCLYCDWMVCPRCKGFGVPLKRWYTPEKA